MMAAFEVTLCDEPVTGWRGKEIEAARVKVAKALAYLGPWCPDCGKRGAKCRNVEACRVRAITRNRPAVAVSLPRPPEAWMVARGYGSYSTAYYAGGRWKNGTVSRFVRAPYLVKASENRMMRERYAYEVAMGRDPDGIEADDLQAVA